MKPLYKKYLELYPLDPVPQQGELSHAHYNRYLLWLNLVMQQYREDHGLQDLTPVADEKIIKWLER